MKIQKKINNSLWFRTGSCLMDQLILCGLKIWTLCWMIVRCCV